MQRQKSFVFDPLHTQNKIKDGGRTITVKTVVEPKIRVYHSGKIFECDIILPDFPMYGAMRDNYKDIIRYAKKQKHVLEPKHGIINITLEVSEVLTMVGSIFNQG
jgi:hypothetical protein